MNVYGQAFGSCGNPLEFQLRMPRTDANANLADAHGTPAGCLSPDPPSSDEVLAISARLT
jgi:hypothetical protein